MIHRAQLRASLPIWLKLLFGVSLRRPDRAFAIIYWYLTRRRVRARNRLRKAAADLLPVYGVWMNIVEWSDIKSVTENQSNNIDYNRPTFSLLLNADKWKNPAALESTVASIRAQVCLDWELILIGRAGAAIATAPQVRHLPLPSAGLEAASALGIALAAATGNFVMVIPPGAMLPVWALACYQRAALNDPEAAIFFGDEDVIDNVGRRSRPWFKPSWNAELVLAQDYVSHAYVIAMSLAQSTGAPPEELADCFGYALLLAATAKSGVVVRHIPYVLCHMSESRSEDVAARVRTVAWRIRHLGASAEVGPFNTVRVRWPMPDTMPLVTIIVPTRDRVDLLEACIGSLLRETTYPNYDVIVADNNSIDPETHAWFAAMSSHDRVSIISYHHPYNYSAINNFVVARARGEYICLLNNDTEIIDGGWLSELMRYATRPEVGAVGAKLLYEDRSIQHAGVAIGIGNAAGHAHRGLPDDQPGYFALAHSPHYTSAVTAACLVVERAKYHAVDGLDETHLQIAYNDVDLCLKLERAGWRNMYAPQAVLIHHESKSRGLDISPQHVERYHRELAVLQARWSTTEIVDPMHHPRLDRSSETYLIQL